MEISEDAHKAHNPTSRNRGRRNLCLGVGGGLLLLILLILLIVILAFTVFKSKHVVTTVTSVELKGLKISPNIPSMRVDLNVSLLVNLVVKNPNKAGFKYGNNSLALLYYRKNVIGQAAIPAGQISPAVTKGLNVTLTVLADRLLSDSNIFSDVISGTIPLTTYTKVSGKVSVLKIFKHHLVSYTWCDLSLDLGNRTVGNSQCRYKTKM